MHGGNGSGPATGDIDAGAGPGGLDALVRREAAALLCFCRCLTGRDGQAAACAQEVFAAVLAMPGPGAPTAFELRKLAVEVATRRLAGDRRRSPALAALQPAFDQSGRRRAGGGDRCGQPCPNRTRAALDALPADARVVVALADGAGLDAAEMSRLLDLDPARVRQRLHRSRAALSALLDRTWAG